MPQSYIAVCITAVCCAFVLCCAFGLLARTMLTDGIETLDPCTTVCCTVAFCAVLLFVRTVSLNVHSIEHRAAPPPYKPTVGRPRAAVKKVDAQALRRQCLERITTWTQDKIAKDQEKLERVSSSTKLHARMTIEIQAAQAKLHAAQQELQALLKTG
jgi:hypothetical protein